MDIFALHFNTLELLNDLPGLIMANMTPSVANIPVFIMMAVNITLGFMLYTNVAEVQKRDGMDIYPLFLHCVLITWDVLCTISVWYLMFAYHFFWLFTLFAILEPIWVVGEVNSIRTHVKDPAQRAEEFLSFGEVTERAAWGYVAIMITVAACFWLSVIFMLGGFENGAILATWPWTNLLFPWLCWQHWESRARRLGTSAGNSMKVQLTIAIQITLSWLPGTWFVLMMPFLANLVFYLVGAATTVLCIINVVKVRKLPKPAHPAVAAAEK